jgi:antitoxin component YwqK of YwqJK toxin-antitoxin module
MRNFLLIVSLILGFSLSAQQSTYTDDDGDGVIEYTLTSKDGKVIETGYYLNGKMHGTWTSFYPSGKKQAVVKFRNGKKNGKWTFFDQEGRTSLVVTYDNDKKIMATQNQYSSR